jgi:putative flippase GtrA
MPPPATSSADVGSEARPVSDGASATWRTLGRHQLGALAATVVDFGTMILLVEIFGLPPVTATAIGAAFGGVTNFTLGRAWIFRNQSGHIATQAFRYALVSGAGAGWNALGEHLVHDRAHVQYVVARGLVSVAVSLLWSFPMQRRFVFREGRA